MDVRRVREGRGFFRPEVREHEEVTEVDLGADARLLPIERGELGPILAGEELAVDKVLAVFGRAEARDFADLSAVADRYGLVYLFQRALDKDRGFDPQVFGEMLDRFDRLPRDALELTVEQLQIHRDRGDDFGLGR